MAELRFDTVIDVPVVRSDSLDSRSFFLELQVAKPSKKTEPQLLTDTRNSNQSPTPAGSIKMEIWHSQLPAGGTGTASHLATPVGEVSEILAIISRKNILDRDCVPPWQPERHCTRWGERDAY
jgi:hypothetical protein